MLAVRYQSGHLAFGNALAIQDSRNKARTLKSLRDRQAATIYDGTALAETAGIIRK
jgi:hypothetical protein